MRDRCDLAWEMTRQMVGWPRFPELSGKESKARMDGTVLSFCLPLVSLADGYVPNEQDSCRFVVPSTGTICVRSCWTSAGRAKLSERRRHRCPSTTGNTQDDTGHDAVSWATRIIGAHVFLLECEILWRKNVHPAKCGNVSVTSMPMTIWLYSIGACLSSSSGLTLGLFGVSSPIMEDISL